MAGRHIGYIRVSTAGQHTDRQLADVRDKLDRIFEDKCSGKNMDRPEWKRCNDFLWQSDTLHVHALDRLGRNARDLLNVLEDLNGRGVSVVIENLGLTLAADGATAPCTKLMITMLGGIAELELSMIAERRREGIAAAKAAGKYVNPRKGKTVSLSPEQVAEARQLHASGTPIAQIAKRYGVSRPTVYRFLGREEDAA